VAMVDLKGMDFKDCQPHTMNQAEMYHLVHVVFPVKDNRMFLLLKVINIDKQLKKYTI
jgi:hypothetical protein